MRSLELETSLGEGFKNLFTESVRNGHGWQMGLYLETMVTDYGGAPSPQYKCCKIPTVSIGISILKENKVGVETSYRFNAYDTYIMVNMSEGCYCSCL